MSSDFNEKPLVSIITPFLNAEKFLEEAIKSVLEQAYDNWELILIDDGSSDESTNIAKHYADLYPDRIFYLEHEGHKNIGISASRNLGMRNSKGEFIAFLDADDVYLPTKLKDQVPLLNTYKAAGMLYSSTKYWYSWTGIQEDFKKDWVWDNFGVAPNTLVNPPKLLKTFFERKGTIPCMGSVLARRKSIDSIGGLENEFDSLYEDQIFYAKMCLDWPIFVSSGYWDLYRQHPSSLCAVSEKPKELAAKLKYYNWLGKYLIENKVSRKSELWKAFNNKTWPYRHPRLHYFFKLYRKFKRQSKKAIKIILRSIIPSSIRKKVKYQLKEKVDFGDLLRVEPINRNFGIGHGLPVDRFYIENFLNNNAHDIYGRVLEIGDARYTNKFGGNSVTQSDVLHIVEGNPKATIVGDLTKADHIPSNTFDCIILTQTLHLIFDLRSAVSTLHRILKTGGVLLVTVPGISQVVKCEWGDNWFWAFTHQSAQLLFEDFFGNKNIQVGNHGNVLAAISFLHGLTVKDLTEDELTYYDNEYQLIITVRAIKST